MSPYEYREIRRSLGTQLEVAEALGVARNTVARRERGEIPLRREAEYAIRWLAHQSTEESDEQG